MMTLLTAAAQPLNGDAYCALTPDKQFIWDKKGDELNKSMFYLMKTKNEHAKKGLHLGYSQGKLTAYPPSIKGMARFYPHNI